MKNSSINFIKIGVFLILLVYGVFSLIEDLDKTPNIRFANFKTDVVEISKASQKTIYNKLNEIEFDEEFDIETYKYPFDYGQANICITYQEGNILHEWNFDGWIIQYDIYEEFEKRTYYKVDDNNEMFIFLRELPKE